MRSPRWVERIQREAASSQRSSSTRVWNSASRYRSNFRAMFWLCARISGPNGILLLRHVAELFEQRQIRVGLDVAGDARVAVPVPGAAEVARRIDHADVLDARLAQPRARQQAAEAAADHHHLDLVRERRAREARLGVGIVEVVGEAALHLDVLRVAVVAQALVALLAIAGAQRVRVESGALRVARSGCRGGHGRRSSASQRKLQHLHGWCKRRRSAGGRPRKRTPGAVASARTRGRYAPSDARRSRSCVTNLR